jgi:hypothetical protein
MMHKPRRSEIEEALAETIFNRGLFRKKRLKTVV